MTLGWLRGHSRTLGLNPDPPADLTFDGPRDPATLPARAVRRRVILDGTIAHERTHWLHHIGTTSGVFQLAVWEAQAHAAKQLITEMGAQLDPHSFPLGTLGYRDPARPLSPRFHNLTEAWLGLRELHHLFAGNQFTGAIDRPNRASFEVLSTFLHRWLIERHPGASAAAHEQAGRYRPPATFGEVSCHAENGKSLGTYHLSECAARLSEFAVMQQAVRELTDRAAGDPGFDKSYLFEGDYGTARRKFYEVTGRRFSHESEAILAALILEGLNTPLPPLSPMDVFTDAWHTFNPYLRFIAFARLTKDFTPRPAQTLTVAEFARIRDGVRAPLLAAGLVLPDSTLHTHARQLFSGFAGIAVPTDLYEVRDGVSFPVDYMRYRYLGRLVYDAFDLYRTAPEFLAFPGLYYATQRTRFQELFDALRPPVVFLHDRGYQPSWDDPAGHGVLMLDAMVNEILFAAMTRGYGDMLGVLRLYARHATHQPNTSSVFQVALLNAGFTETFAAATFAQLEF